MDPPGLFSWSHSASVPRLNTKIPSLFRILPRYLVFSPSWPTSCQQSSQVSGEAPLRYESSCSTRQLSPEVGRQQPGSPAHCSGWALVQKCIWNAGFGTWHCKTHHGSGPLPAPSPSIPQQTFLCKAKRQGIKSYSVRTSVWATESIQKVPRASGEAGWITVCMLNTDCSVL